MLAKASPLNPIDLIDCKSSNADNFDVVCLSHRIGKSSYWNKKLPLNDKPKFQKKKFEKTYGHFWGAFDAKNTVVRRVWFYTDSMAIIRNLNEFEASILNNNMYGGGPRIKAVLNELLDGCNGALDDLTSCNSVDYRLIKALDPWRILWWRRKDCICFHNMVVF